MNLFIQQRNSAAGFTLLEALLVIAISGIVLGALSVFIISSYRGYYYNMEEGQAINEARRGVETMVREIREARYADDGSYPLVKAGDNEFIFFSDIDRDGSSERVSYLIQNGSLKKEVIKASGDPPQYLIANTSTSTISNFVINSPNPIFTYYNGDWPGDTAHNPLPTLTRLTDTKLMHVHLEVNVTPSRPPNNFTLESDAQIRNLKTNL